MDSMMKWNGMAHVRIAGTPSSYESWRSMQFDVKEAVGESNAGDIDINNPIIGDDDGSSSDRFLCYMLHYPHHGQHGGSSAAPNEPESESYSRSRMMSTAQATTLRRKSKGLD